ncbi:hypothetical protein HanRHA438_Chr04g0167211 [Helianthus annuus]|nr:hypothetical protein HanRHA438_Chr04g0167211 [Helianthus annuus]
MLVVRIRVIGALAGRVFGDPIPRSGTPPPSLRGPKSGSRVGEESPHEEGGDSGPIACNNQSSIFLFFNKKTSHLRGECRHQIGV